MEFRDLLKRLLNSYFVIYGCSFLGTWLFCIIFSPGSTFGLDYFADMALLALMGDLPGLLFYSSKELSKKQWNVRLLLHFAVLEAVLLSFGKYLNLYHTPVQGVIFAGIVLLVYGIVRGVCFAMDYDTARNINDKLREMKRS